LSFFLIEIGNLVTQVDNLNNEINASKNKTIQGVDFTEPKVNVSFDKVAQQARLNLKLKQFRESMLLMMFAFLFVLCIILYLGYYRLRARLHAYPNK
jgi:hypothetical protein